MAWCRQATSHCLNQCWPRSSTPYGVTRPQWVNIWEHPSCSNEHRCQWSLQWHHMNIITSQIAAWIITYSSKFKRTITTDNTNDLKFLCIYIYQGIYADWLKWAQNILIIQNKWPFISIELCTAVSTSFLFLISLYLLTESHFCTVWTNGFLICYKVPGDPPGVKWPGKLQDKFMVSPESLHMVALQQSSMVITHGEFFPKYSHLIGSYQQMKPWKTQIWHHANCVFTGNTKCHQWCESWYYDSLWFSETRRCVLITILPMYTIPIQRYQSKSLVPKEQTNGS